MIDLPVCYSHSHQIHNTTKTKAFVRGIEQEQEQEQEKEREKEREKNNSKNGNFCLPVVGGCVICNAISH